MKSRRRYLRTLPAALLGLLALNLAGCGPTASTAVAPAIDQASLCRVSDYDVAEGCSPGQKIVFLPETFGNEQLPVIFAALNCDLRYAVALTNGAVTCIHAPVQPPKAPPAAAEKP